MLGRMRRIVGIGAAWVGATVVSVIIASTAVAGIRDGVVQTPVAIGAPTTTTTTTTTVPTAATVATSTTLAVPTTAEPVDTSVPVTTEISDVSTSTTAPPATTTTTTTTTTSAPPVTTVPPSYPTYDLVGGTVVLRVANGTVAIESVVPQPGFSYRPEKTGPDEIDVAFVGDDHKSVLTAHFEDGQLKVVPKEEGEDEHDGGEHDG